jgi:hypothetical protein
MHFDRRRLIDPQHAIVVEVSLLYAAFVDGNRAVERGRQPEDKTALELRDHAIRIDRDSGIHRADDAPYPNLTVAADLDLGDGGDEAGKGDLRRDAAPAALPGALR